jgi:hypothetical protein
MYKILRIIFCILAVVLAAVAIFVFVYAGWVYGIIVVVAAMISAWFMVFFKRKQEEIDPPTNTNTNPEQKPPKGDYITGKKSKD